MPYRGLVGSSRARSYQRRAHATPGACSTDSARPPTHRTGRRAPRRARDRGAIDRRLAAGSRRHTQGIADARIGLDTGVSEVVERTEDIVVVAGREREFQERRIRDLAGRAPSEETALEQVLLASPSSRRDLWRGPNGTLVLERPLQYADSGVERRARALRRFAVPTAVIELSPTRRRARLSVGRPK
jgi:hypothetical protein